MMQMSRMDSNEKMRQKNSSGFQADHVLSYFKLEWAALATVTVSGLIYNLGLLAGPWFEGKMTDGLVDILGKKAVFNDMLILVLGYVIAIAVVQVSRYIKTCLCETFCE